MAHEEADNGYFQALEKAGAEVVDFKEFGSYQGEWYALVRHAGKLGFVHGSYGSCSGCDAYEAEFGYSYGDEDEPAETLDKRIAEFGMRYLDDFLTLEQAISAASEHLEWDMDAQEMVDWVQSHADLVNPPAPQTVARVTEDRNRVLEM